MTIHEHLKQIGACLPAQQWASTRSTGEQCWRECDRIDWLFWWAAKTGQVKQVVECAKQIAESVKHLQNTYAAAAAAAAAYATAAAADAVTADAAYAAYATAATAAYADAADAYAADAYAADAAYAAYATAAAAYKAQKEVNMQIARKLLVCPFTEDTNQEVK